MKSRRSDKWRKTISIGMGDKYRTARDGRTTRFHRLRLRVKYRWNRKESDGGHVTPARGKSRASKCMNARRVSASKESFEGTNGCRPCETGVWEGNAIYLAASAWMRCIVAFSKRRLRRRKRTGRFVVRNTRVVANKDSGVIRGLVREKRRSMVRVGREKWCRIIECWNMGAK